MLRQQCSPIGNKENQDSNVVHPKPHRIVIKKPTRTSGEKKDSITSRRRADILSAIVEAEAENDAAALRAIAETSLVQGEVTDNDEQAAPFKRKQKVNRSVSFSIHSESRSYSVEDPVRLLLHIYIMCATVLRERGGV